MKFFKQRRQIKTLLVITVLLLLLMGSIYFAFIRYAPNPLDSFMFVQGQHCQAGSPSFDVCLKMKPWILIVSLPNTSPRVVTDAQVIQHLNENIHLLQNYSGDDSCPLEELHSTFGIMIYHNAQIIIQGDVHGTGCREIDLHLLDGKKTTEMRLTNDTFWLLLEKVGISDSQFFPDWSKRNVLHQN
jgi:hypothetical protein